MSEHTNALSRRAFLGAAATMGAATCLLSINPLDAYAVTAAQKKAEAAAALDSLSAMQDKLDAASDVYYDALSEQEDAQNKMTDAQNRIDEANEQIQDLQEQLSVRARSMYRSGSSTFIDLLLGATSFRAFTTNWGVLNNMNESDAQMVQSTKDLKAEVEEQKAVYAEQEQIAAEKAAAAKVAKDEAATLVQQQQSIYNSLSAEAEQLMREEQEARERAAAAAAAAAIEAQRRNTSSSGRNSNTANKGNTSYANNKPQTVSGNTAVQRAYAMLGKPYAWGAGGPDSFDCSGFVSYCLTGSFNRALGTTSSMAAYPQVSDPKPGDICWKSGHVGLYIGNGQMIHAPQTGDVVKISGVQSSMIYRRY